MSINLTAMNSSKASKDSSQPSKSPKASLLKRVFERLGKCRRNKPVTPSPTVTPSAPEPSTAGFSTVEGLDAIASMTGPTATTASAPAATASDTTASGPTAPASDASAPDASAPAASAIRPPAAAHSNVPSSSPEHSTADAAVPNREQSEASASTRANTDMNGLGGMVLWGRACAGLERRDKDSKESKCVSKVTEFHSFPGTMQVLFFLDLRRLRGAG